MARQVASSAILAGLFKGDSSANDEDDEDGGNGCECERERERDGRWFVPTQPSRKVAVVVVEVGGRRTNDAVVGRKHVSAVSVARTSFMVLVW